MADPVLHSRWRHVKRGTRYLVVGIARMQCADDLDDAPLVVYRGQDGQLWARPRIEFLDGRFEKLSDPPRPQRRGHRLCDTYAAAVRAVPGLTNAELASRVHGSANRGSTVGSVLYALSRREGVVFGQRGEDGRTRWYPVEGPSHG